MPIEDQLSEINLDNHFRFGGNRETANFRQETLDNDDDNYQGDNVDKLPNGYHITEIPDLIPRRTPQSLKDKLKEKYHVEMPRM